jgi:hypothetical protein
VADVTSPFGFPYPEDTDLVRDGATDIENLAEGVNDYLNGGYLYAGTEYYTSSGTFDKADPLGTGDIGLRAIRVRCQGGGGGGGGASGGVDVSAGGGGGGGDYAEKFITDIAGLSASVVVTRGAGGGGGAAGNNAGATGANSTFGAEVVALGGGGGAGAVNSDLSILALRRNAVNGVFGDNVGDVVRRYQTSNSPGLFGLSSGASIGGGGGDSFFGGGARSTSANADGEPASLYGTGGGGAAIRNEVSGRPGGNGANGIVIIDCFV